VNNIYAASEAVMMEEPPQVAAHFLAPPAELRVSSPTGCLLTS